MFIGSYAITMDAKGRMAIPAKVRDALSSVCEGRLVVTAHTEERCLLVYPEPQWLDLQPKIEALPNIHRKARRMQRLLLGYATPLELDGNGRVLLPQTLRDYANLEKKQPLLPFSFDCIKIKLASLTILKRSLPAPDQKKRPFFALIAIDPNGKWLSARGKGGGLALWVQNK